MEMSIFSLLRICPWLRAAAVSSDYLCSSATSSGYEDSWSIQICIVSAWGWTSQSLFGSRSRPPLRGGLSPLVWFRSEFACLYLHLKKRPDILRKQTLDHFKQIKQCVNLPIDNEGMAVQYPHNRFFWLRVELYNMEANYTENPRVTF